MRSREKLADMTLEAFWLACKLDRFDVAEHLLCALETLDPSARSPRREQDGSDQLEEAYLSIAATVER